MDHDQSTSTPPTPATARDLPAQIELFGFAPTTARVAVIARSRGWRVSRTLIALSIAWGAIPIVFWLPPHFPWVLGAFGVGIYLAWKYLTQFQTILSFQGNCPKCGAALSIDKPASLRTPHKLSCADCHNDLYLEVSLG